MYFFRSFFYIVHINYRFFEFFGREFLNYNSSLGIRYFLFLNLIEKMIFAYLTLNSF